MVAIGHDEIAYLDVGAGAPLLLLHGVGHSSTAWLRSLPALSSRFRVLAPDLPGHGRRAHYPRDVMHQKLIDCISWMEKTH